MNSGIVVVQGEKIRYVNPALLRIAGATSEHLLGRPYAELIAPDLRERDMGYYRDRVAGRGAPEQYETRVLREDGGVREVRILARLSEWNGSPASLVIMSDITELRELERERERFFRFMVHELRAPLSPIVTILALFRRPDVVANEEKFKSMVAMMSRSVDRLRSFVDDFLDLSKLDQQSLAVRRERIDLRELIGDVVEGQRLLAQDKGLELVVPDWEPFSVEGDPVVVRTLTQNLLNNAVKYTDDGRVTLRVEEQPHMFRVEVSDTGAGLAAEEQAMLFQEYGRIKRTDGVKGTGLGLALVKKLVDVCGGSVSVKSEGKGKGSAFTFVLPRVFGDPQTG
jgi:PAS domain S-box-containing protein